MNIFFLFLSPILSAQALCDKHVVKMPLEAAQLLSTAFRFLNGERPRNKRKKQEKKEIQDETTKKLIDEHNIYRMTHVNHPMAIWVRTSLENFEWLLTHGIALCNEWKYRYNHDENRKHACMRIFEFMQQHKHSLQFPEYGLTVPPQCVTEHCKILQEPLKWEDTVSAYRIYYQKDKKDITQWEKKPERKPKFIIYN